LWFDNRKRWHLVRKIAIAWKNDLSLPGRSIIKINLILMNAQEAQTLQLHEIVVWTPDGTKGEVIVLDGSGVKVRWEDDQCGYYQFTDLLSQIERLP
jgi:hypothetical protein